MYRPNPLLLLIFVGILFPSLSYPAEVLHYQGTHILTFSTMAKLADAFEKQTGIKVEVKGGGCADGVVVVVNDRFEMGGLCCPLKPGEREDLGLVAHPVARDIKTVITHPENPLENITTAQLKLLHQGRITNWREIGWIDKPIAVIYRTHCLDRQEPVRIFLGIDNKLDNLTRKAIKVRTDKEVIDYVSQFPTAIGITSNVFVRDKNIRKLSIDNIAPSVDNVTAGRYLFSAMLYIVTKGQPDLKTQQFIDFVRSETGQAIVKENLAGVP